jgi:hypothetical protein
MPSSEWPARAVRSGSPTSSRPALAVRMPQSSSHAMSACARRATSNTVVGCSLRLSRADRARGRESRARAQRQRDHVPARAIGQARHRGLRSEPCRFPAAHGRAAVDLRPSAVDVRPLQALESSASTLAETSSRSGAASTSLSPPDAQGELTNRQRPRLGIQPRGRVRPRHLQDSRLSHPIRQLLRPAPREQPIITTAEDGHRHGDVRDRVRPADPAGPSARGARDGGSLVAPLRAMCLAQIAGSRRLSNCQRMYRRSNERAAGSTVGSAARARPLRLNDGPPPEPRLASRSSGRSNQYDRPERRRVQRIAIASPRCSTLSSRGGSALPANPRSSTGCARVQAASAATAGMR